MEEAAITRQASEKPEKGENLNFYYVLAASSTPADDECDKNYPTVLRGYMAEIWKSSQLLEEQVA